MPHEHTIRRRGVLVADARRRTLGIRPADFKDESIPLCEMSFEEALRRGKELSEEVKDSWIETSARICVDGLYKRYEAFSEKYRGSTPRAMMRNVSWWWSSFCCHDKTLQAVGKAYRELLIDLAESTDYEDLLERMNQTPSRLKHRGWARHHVSLSIPPEPQKVISRTATAVALPFTVFYQLGLARAIASNEQGLYQDWNRSKVVPLFDEVMAQAEKRLVDLREIKLVATDRRSR